MWYLESCDGVTHRPESCGYTWVRWPLITCVRSSYVSVRGKITRVYSNTVSSFYQLYGVGAVQLLRAYNAVPVRDCTTQCFSTLIRISPHSQLQMTQKQLLARKLRNFLPSGYLIISCYILYLTEDCAQCLKHLNQYFAVLCQHIVSTI